MAVGGVRKPLFASAQLAEEQWRRRPARAKLRQSDPRSIRGDAEEGFSRIAVPKIDMMDGQSRSALR